MELIKKFINRVIHKQSSSKIQKAIDEINEILEKHRYNSAYFENSIYFEQHKGWFDFFQR